MPVRLPTAAEALAALARVGHRPDDPLVLNAGVGADVGIRSETAEHVDTTIDVNLRAPIVMAVAFAQHKLAVGEPGQIVMVGSLSGLVATPDTRMYNATKFGLRGFAHSLRQDLDGSGIGLTLVSPGFIRDAGMFADSGSRTPPGVGTASPEDVANGVIVNICVASRPANVPRPARRRPQARQMQTETIAVAGKIRKALVTAHQGEVRAVKIGR